MHVVEIHLVEYVLNLNISYLRYMPNKPQSSRPAAADFHNLMGRELSNAVVFFHEAVAAHVGMNAAEWKCLGLLDQHGSLTASRLAELSGFTTGAITGIVDRLERGGYVRRNSNPEDRRSVIVEAVYVKELKDRVIPIFQSLGEAMALVAGRYSKSELAAVTKFLSETTAVLRNETVKLKHSPPRPKVGRSVTPASLKSTRIDPP